MSYLVMCGNPCDGLSFTGPFESAEDASEYADTLKCEWWIASMEAPPCTP
jgi:hypothetical protein